MALESEVTAMLSDSTVKFELTIRNPTDNPVCLTFRSSLKADFAVLKGNEEIWRESDEKMYTGALETETIGAGAERTYNSRWVNTDSGSYTVVASLNTMDDLETQTTFLV